MLELKFRLELPSYYGDIVTKLLKSCDPNIEYDVYTINDNLEVVKIKGVIRNNGYWNYHHNYDDSSNELQIINKNGSYTPKWFTFYEKEAIEIQQQLVEKWKQILNNEIKRLDELKIPKQK